MACGWNSLFLVLVSHWLHESVMGWNVYHCRSFQEEDYKCKGMLSPIFTGSVVWAYWHVSIFIICGILFWGFLARCIIHCLPRTPRDVDENGVFGRGRGNEGGERSIHKGALVLAAVCTDCWRTTHALFFPMRTRPPFEAIAAMWSMSLLLLSVMLPSHYFLGGQYDFFSLCLFPAFPSPQCPFGVCSFSKSFPWSSFWGRCTCTFLKWFCVGRCVDFVGEEGTLLVSGSRYISHNAHPYAKQTLPCIPRCMSLLSWFPFKNGVIIFMYTLLMEIERVLPWNFCHTISMTGCQHKMEKA